jgi:hypothetical protein
MSQPIVAYFCCQYWNEITPQVHQHSLSSQAIKDFLPAYSVALRSSTSPFIMRAITFGFWLTKIFGLSYLSIYSYFPWFLCLIFYAWNTIITLLFFFWQFMSFLHILIGGCHRMLWAGFGCLLNGGESKVKVSGPQFPSRPTYLIVFHASLIRFTIGT